MLAQTEVTDAGGRVRARVLVDPYVEHFDHVRLGEETEAGKYLGRQGDLGVSCHVQVSPSTGLS